MEEEDDYENGKLRNHRNRAGVSDLVGSRRKHKDTSAFDHVSRRDDESIDDNASEVGWESEEDHDISTSIKKKKQKKKHGGRASAASEDSGTDSEEDQDDEEDGCLLLSDVLLQNLSRPQAGAKLLSETSHISSSSAHKPATSSSVARKIVSFEGLAAGLQEEEDDDIDSDENASEEEASSEEEAQDDDADDETEDDDEEELEEVHQRLLAAIDKFAKTESPAMANASASRTASQATSESRFSTLLDGNIPSTALASASIRGGAGDGAVSMDALLGALEDVQGLNVVKQHLADLEKGLAAPKHVEKVIAERVERDQTYLRNKEEMNKWQETVVSNRHVRTLDLAQDKRRKHTATSLVNRFTPTTPMEKEIQMVLVKNGTATDASVLEAEEKELTARNVSLKEMRERQAELAKVRALMFYEQMKRHRINKIKSKSFRKIQKRKKARLEENLGAAMQVDGDDEAAVERAERAAMNRVKERMNLRHKNTSKWARMALKHGHTDESLKDAYHESVRLGQELTQRINEETVREDDDSDSDDQLDADHEGVSKSATHAMHSAIADSEAAQEEHLQQASSGKFRKLFEMDFMKKAAEQQRERAREEARDVLKQIHAMENDDLDEDDISVGNKIDADNQPSVEEKKQAMAEVSEMLSQGKESGRNAGHSNGMLISKSKLKRKVVTAADDNEEPSGFGTLDEEPVLLEDNSSLPSANVTELEDNPWILPNSIGGKSSGKRKSVQLFPAAVEVSKSSSKANFTTYATALKGIDSALSGGDRAASSIDNNKNNSNTTSKAKRRNRRKGSNIDEKVDDHVADDKQLIKESKVEENQEVEVAAASSSKKQLLLAESSKSQAQLVREAFAGPDLEAEFEAYKAQQIDAELGVDEKKMNVLKQVKAGWGDWAGPGAMVVSEKIKKKRDRLISNIQMETDKKKMERADVKKPKVMISERRIKTASKFKIADIPHPFKTREEYERSLQMPIGDEWNSSVMVKKNTAPAIRLRAGRVVEPIKLATKKRSAPEDAKSMKQRSAKISRNATTSMNRR